MHWREIIKKNLKKIKMENITNETILALGAMVFFYLMCNINNDEE